MRLIACVVLWLLASPVYAATYYVDFVGGSDSNNGTSTSTPWKRVKGMVGVTGTAASATLTSGDTIVFKGGVTWTGTFPWNPVGGSASMITYTTDHSWYTGGSFSQPTFDNEGNSTTYTDTPTVTNIVGGSYTLRYATFNDLSFYRCGPSGGPHDGTCFYLQNIQDFTVSNCTFEAYAGRFVMWINQASSGTWANITLTGNDVSHAGSFLWLTSTTGSAITSNLIYTHNTLHDFASQLGAVTGEGNHGDGFFHYFSVPTTDSTQYLDGMTFCHNRTYGDFTRGIGTGTGEDMTGFFFVEGAVKNVLICNNVFAMSPAQNSTTPLPVWGDGHIFLRSYGNTGIGSVWIYNNTFGFQTSSANSGSALITTDSGWTGLHIKNNILSVGTYCTWDEAGPTPTGSSDYNEYRCPNGFAGSWITDGGHSIFNGSPPNSDPQWQSPFTDFHLTASSPGKGTGVDLSAASGLSAAQQTALNTDYDGVTRSGTWDMGAYAYATGGGSSSGGGMDVKQRQSNIIFVRER